MTTQADVLSAQVTALQAQKSFNSASCTANNLRIDLQITQIETQIAALPPAP